MSVFSIYNHGSGGHRDKPDDEIVAYMGRYATGEEYVNFLITDGVGGKVGNLVVSLVNTDSKSHRVAITSASSGGAAYVTVEPGQVKKVGTQPDKASSSNVFLTPFDALPGSNYDVYFLYGDATGVKLQVPVLDGGLPDYKDLVPPTILPAQG